MVRYKPIRRSNVVGYTEMLPANLYGQHPFGNVLVVDSVYGDDTTGARNLNPYLTIGAAVAAATSGDTVLVLPGTYTLSSALTLGSGVSLIGLNGNACIVQMSVSATTTMITMGASSRLENLTLSLTSSSAVDLTGISLPSTTSATAKIRFVDLTVDNTGYAGGGTTAVYGIRSNGSGTPTEEYLTMRGGAVKVLSASLGVKRALLVDSANNFVARGASFRCSGTVSANYIGIESNHASAIVSIFDGFAFGTTHDISKTLGALTFDGLLKNSTCNALNFTNNTYLGISLWGVAGTPSTNSTQYIRPGTEVTSANEVKMTVHKACVLKDLRIRTRTSPANNATVTVRKNGVNTALTVTLTGGNTSASDTTNAVTFAAGDDVSVQLTTASGLQASDWAVSIGMV